jgi:hypothetical protein
MLQGTAGVEIVVAVHYEVVLEYDHRSMIERKVSACQDVIAKAEPLGPPEQLYPQSRRTVCFGDAHDLRARAAFERDNDRNVPRILRSLDRA